MKILFANVGTYMPQDNGGLASSTNDLCSALREKAHDVGVICNLEVFDALWLVNRIKSKLTGREFIEDRYFPYPVFRGYDVAKGIEEVINEFQPDVAVVQSGSSFSLVNTFSELKVPVICYARDVEFHENKCKLHINKYVGFIANSAFTARKLKAKFDVDALVLPPLVDPSKYIVDSSREFVLHIGLVEKKGIETSFALAERRPDIEFKFIESWEIPSAKFTAYQLRAKKLKNVTICRRTNDMRKYYKLAKIMLVPSVWEEAWGRVVTESQFSGIPSIASNRGGLPESVGIGGIIMPHDASIDQWEEKLSLLWDHPDIYRQFSDAALTQSQAENISKSFIINEFVAFLNTQRKIADHRTM